VRIVWKIFEIYFKDIYRDDTHPSTTLSSFFPDFIRVHLGWSPGKPDIPAAIDHDRGPDDVRGAGISKEKQEVRDVRG
jgi:hypothetical protein